MTHLASLLSDARTELERCWFAGQVPLTYAGEADRLLAGVQRLLGVEADSAGQGETKVLEA